MAFVLQAQASPDNATLRAVSGVWSAKPGGLPFRKPMCAVADLAAVNAGTPFYLPVQGYWNAAISGGNAARARSQATEAATAKNARLCVNVAVAATTTVTATLQVNEVDTAIVITYNDTHAADTDRPGTGLTAPIPAGARRRWKLEHNNAASRAIVCGLSYDEEVAAP